MCTVVHTIEQVSRSNKNVNHSIESRNVFCLTLVKKEQRQHLEVIVVSLPYASVVVYQHNHISFCIINTFFMNGICRYLSEMFLYQITCYILIYSFEVYLEIRINKWLRLCYSSKHCNIFQCIYLFIACQCCFIPCLHCEHRVGMFLYNVCFYSCVYVNLIVYEVLSNSFDILLEPCDFVTIT